MSTSNQTMAAVGSGVMGWIRPIGILAVLGVIGYGGWYGLNKTILQGGDDSAKDVDTVAVSLGNLLITVVEDGELESADNVDVKCDVAGGSTIIEIVDDGSIVSEGDLIIELDKKPIEDQINQQQNVYEKARATVIQAQQDLNVATISIDEYENGTFVQQLQDADAQIKIAEENLRSSQNALAHAQRMFRKGYVSLLELETQQFAVERSQLELDSANTSREVLVDFTKRKTLEDLNAQRDIAQARLNAENAAFELEESALEQLREQLEQCEIFSPAEGMIVYSNSEASRFGGGQGVTIEKGAAVKERQSIVKIPDLSQMQVNVKVHESKVEYLERGMPALIRVSGREFQGYVVSIANQPEATSRWTGNVKEYATVVRIEGQPEDLRPGMTAEVEILIADLTNVAKVPVSTVVDVRGRYHVWVVNDGELDKREVEIGLTDGEFVEIRSGLEEGDEVVRNPRAVVDEAGDEEGIEEEDQDGASRFGERNNSYSSDGGSPGARQGAGGRGEGGRGEGGRGQGGRGDGGRGGQSGGGGGGRGNFDVMQWDADGDSLIQESEIPAQLSSYVNFSEWDTNGDGGLTQEEMTAGFAKMRGGQ